jgi:hypothetical protein
MLPNSVSVLLPVLFVLVLGYWAGLSKRFDADQVKGVNELVLDFALPAIMFVGIVKGAPGEAAAEKPFLVVSAALLGNAPAKAAVFDITYVGTVSSGYDTIGLFGNANTDLTGANFSATFRFDTSLSPNGSSGPNYSDTYGGAAYSGPSPLVSSSISIGSSAAVPVSGSWIGYAWVNSNPVVGFNDRYANATQSQSPQTYLDLRVYTYVAQFPSALDAAFHYVVQPSAGDSGTGSALFNNFQDAFAYLTVTEFTVSPVVTETPLPAALPLFASVLVGGGALSWRKRRKQQAA